MKVGALWFNEASIDVEANSGRRILCKTDGTLVVHWPGGLLYGKIRIELVSVPLLDGSATAPTVIEDSLANSGRYAWPIPETAASGYYSLRLTSLIGTPDSTFTPKTNAANSEVFRLRGAGQYQIQVETTDTVSSDFAIQITLQGSTGNSFQTAISGSAVAGTPAVNPLVLVNEIGVVTYIAVTSTYTWTGALNSVVRVYQRFASGSKRGRNPFKACSALVYLSRAGLPSHGTNAMHS